MSSPTTPPSHARPSHHITTPRLIIRSAHVDDAIPFLLIRSDPINNPFGGVVDAASQITESEQRARLSAQALTTASGKNAFLNIILKPTLPCPPTAEHLRVHDGILIGMTGFNTFIPSPLPTSPTSYIGDTGALITHHFPRQGLATEALQGVIEYGFTELGLLGMKVETNEPNHPFRALMRGMGLGEGREGDDEEPSVVWEFGRKEWDGAKEGMWGRGKWYL